MTDYKTIVMYSKDDGAFLAYAPDYPGCVEDGQTKEEALKNLDALVDEYKDIAREKKWTLPVPVKTVDQIDINKAADYFIASDTPNLTAKKLQKLCFYSYVWALVWFNKDLFARGFEAWRDGPVNRELFQKFRGHKNIAPKKAHVDVGDNDKFVFDAVLNAYGNMTGDELGQLTHKEGAWTAARGGIPDNESCKNLITDAQIIKYYI